MGKSAIRRAGIYGIIWLYLGGDLSLVKKMQYFLTIRIALRWQGWARRDGKGRMWRE